MMRQSGTSGQQQSANIPTPGMRPWKRRREPQVVSAIMEMAPQGHSATQMPQPLQ
jgi:hypothetical protein